MTGHTFGILLQSNFPGCILAGVALPLLLVTQDRVFIKLQAKKHEENQVVRASHCVEYYTK